MKPRWMAIVLIGVLLAGALSRARGAMDEATYQRVVAAGPQPGDVVFTRIGGPLFARVAETSGSWTSHVGIIVDYRDGDWVVAESRIPCVTETPLRAFLGRSAGGAFSIRRLNRAPTPDQQVAMRVAAEAHLHELYGLGFNLDGTHPFCSKFVRDVVQAGTGQSLGEVETFGQLLHRNPKAPLTFWKVWYLGRIPWERRTVTPASELNSPQLHPLVEHRA